MKDDYIFFSKEVVNEILENVNTSPPETGGIIGMKENVVCKMEYDEGKRTYRACSYYPNVDRLNEIIFGWQKTGIQFVGLYHTHYFGVSSLSEGDELYIKQIMFKMPDNIKKLLFPIVVMPQKEIVLYSALKDGHGVIIEVEEIKYI